MASSKVFVDTNVILDYLLNREGADEAEKILRQLGKPNCCISLASFYTITYYVEVYLKKQGLENTQRMLLLRKILNSLLENISVCSIGEAELSQGINNPDFNDLEDSYQMETAVNEGCVCLITKNIKDFRGNTNPSIKILTPAEYLNT